jgi:hypothetical protein
MVRNDLVRLLRAHGIIKCGRRADTSTKQVFIAGVGRIACYQYNRKKLLALTA